MTDAIYPPVGDVADLEKWLGDMSQGNADEALLTRLLKAASQDLQSAVGRDMTQVTTQTEYRVVPYSHRIALRVPPVVSLTSVSFVPASLTDTAQLPLTVSSTPNEAAAYVLEGILYVPRAVREGSKLAIVYQGGFSQVPDDFYQAVIELAGLRYKDRKHIGEESKSLGGETVHYNTKEWNNFIKGIVSRYRPKVYS